jgi:recombination associated protein RdgC
VQRMSCPFLGPWETPKLVFRSRFVRKGADILGAFKGPLSYSRFYVRGNVDDVSYDRMVELIRLRAFEPLKLDDEESERFGWCSIQNPLDIDLDHQQIVFNSYINIGLRYDRWSIPSSMLKAHLAEAERDYKAKNKRERLGKTEKVSLKTMVVRKLREEVPPSMRSFDLSWNLNSGIVRFWSQSTKVQEHMVELFEQTFAVELDAENPTTAAMRRGLSAAESDAFQTLMAINFADTSGVTHGLGDAR